ncbi:unnamed protein product [Leptidea sinapis]|uniref:Nose resistant-to-fluoxetine protein N-terminal domain-containing protein n=1 Tax=Leptidea sinapis TaxID=189913 RepID=A0A5E4PNS9_9NEOP|nr:unnamed protein product [Leptidea sinapis]
MRYFLEKKTSQKTYDIILGVCLPQSCAAEDIITIINFSVMLNDNLKYNNTLSRNIKVTSIRQIQEYVIQNDIVAILLILITAILILLAILATLVDYEVFSVKQSKTSFDLSKFKNIKIDNNLETKRAAVDVHKPVIVDALMKNVNNMSTVRITDVNKLPLTTLDVAAVEGLAGNCSRCGKYKKQCAIQMQFDNLGPCPRAKYNSCASLTMEYKKKNGCLKTLLLSFSLKHSWMRIFNTNMANKDLAVVHVIKNVTILWIIFVHTVVTVVTGTLAFDTMFFVSGVFSAHHFFYLKGRYTVEELVSCRGPCGQALQTTTPLHIHDIPSRGSCSSIE